jgi:septation ring formation regulator EzrA
MARQRNEGEGNKTAAREFNEAQQRFVKDGQWQDAAKDAARAVEGPEAEALRRAEEKGRKPAAAEKGVPRSGGTKTAGTSKRS